MLSITYWVGGNSEVRYLTFHISSELGILPKAFMCFHNPSDPVPNPELSLNTIQTLKTTLTPSGSKWYCDFSLSSFPLSFQVSPFSLSPFTPPWLLFTFHHLTTHLFSPCHPLYLFLCLSPSPCRSDPHFTSPPSSSLHASALSCLLLLIALMLSAFPCGSLWVLRTSSSHTVDDSWTCQGPKLSPCSPPRDELHPTFNDLRGGYEEDQVPAESHLWKWGLPKIPPSLWVWQPPKAPTFSLEAEWSRWPFLPRANMGTWRGDICPL